MDLSKEKWVRIGMWASCACSAIAGLLNGGLLFLLMAGFLGWHAYNLPWE